MMTVRYGLKKVEAPTGSSATLALADERAPHIRWSARLKDCRWTKTTRRKRKADKVSCRRLVLPVARGVCLKVREQERELRGSEWTGGTRTVASGGGTPSSISSRWPAGWHAEASMPPGARCLLALRLSTQLFRLHSVRFIILLPVRLLRGHSRRLSACTREDAHETKAASWSRTSSRLGDQVLSHEPREAKNETLSLRVRPSAPWLLPS